MSYLCGNFYKFFGLFGKNIPDCRNNLVVWLTPMLAFRQHRTLYYVYNGNICQIVPL